MKMHSFAGRGAWRDWVYEAEVINLINGRNQSFGKMKNLQLTVDNLLPNTPYKFRVRATSQGGYGPWSEYFESFTLKDSKSNPVAENNVIHTLNQCLHFCFSFCDSILDLCRQQHRRQHGV